MIFCFYDVVTGAIRAVRNTHCVRPEDCFDPPGLPAGWQALQIDPVDWPDPDRQYVDLGGREPQIAPRPLMPVAVDKETIEADGRDGATITGIPNGTLATISDDSGQMTVRIDDGYLIITAGAPQLIMVEFEAEPYRKLRLGIRAI